VNGSRALWLLLGTVLVATAWSAWRPHDYPTWAFELLPGLTASAVLLWLGFTKRFRFSAVVYVVCATQFVILAAGAKYTYEQMPLFEWLRTALDLSRNHSDRLGHFFQGMSPTLVVRELLVRRTNIRRRWLAGALAGSVAVAFSACYEIVEWLWVVSFYPNQGPAWLGHQGDPWDAQADMLMALCGAIVAATLLARWQDREITRGVAS
jgi:putative membrane protein